MKADSEAAFQVKVLNLAKFYGWEAYHTHDSRRSHPGWPDLVLCRPPEILFVELKTDKGRVRPEQQEWLERLAECGLTAAVWRPAMLHDIHMRLAAGRTVVPASWETAA